jgi:two-component system OmpR family response regulator
MKTILLADDSASIREYCRAALEDEGYRVAVACNGADAVRVFRAESPDLAILDICMPEINGLEALERIRMIAPQVPVILFTAYDEDCVRDRRGSMATACVEKSADLTELKRAVNAALRASEPEGNARPLRLGLPPDRCNAAST